MNHARPNAPAAVLWGTAPSNLTFAGAILAPLPAGPALPLSIDARGVGVTSFAWPGGPLPTHTQIWFQAWTIDPLGPFGLSASSALLAQLP